MPGVLDKLSAPVRALLSQAWATHESAHVFATSYGEAHRQAENGDKGANAKAVDAPEYPSAIHPVIIRHPITGVESLYVNRGFTTKIIGLQPYESKALLSMIYDVQSNATECEFACSRTDLALEFQLLTSIPSLQTRAVFAGPPILSRYGTTKLPRIRRISITAVTRVRAIG